MRNKSYYIENQVDKLMSMTYWSSVPESHRRYSFYLENRLKSWMRML